MIVRLIGQIDVPTDRQDSVMAALPEHIRLSRAESGCISFEVTENSAHPGRLDVAETFESRIAFDAHQTRTKSSDWWQVTKGIPRQYEIIEDPT